MDHHTPVTAPRMHGVCAFLLRSSNRLYMFVVQP